MAGETTNVKVARLETQMDNFGSELKEVKSIVKEVNIKLDNYSNLQGEIKNLEAEIREERINRKAAETDFAKYKDEIRKEIQTSRRYKTLSNIVIGLVCAVSGSLLTVLIINYLDSH